MNRKRILSIVVLLLFLYLETQYFENRQEVIYSQEKNVADKGSIMRVPEMTNIVQVALFEDTYYVLDDTGNIWTWNQQQGKEEAKYFAGIEHVIKIVDAGEAIYALTQEGDVYAWGSNAFFMVAPEQSNENIYCFPQKIKELSNIKDIDAGNGNAFAIDNSGRLFMWGLDIYPLWKQDRKPGFPEEKIELVDNVEKIYMGAESFHYFQRQDGSFFSIMDLEHNLDNLAYFIFLCFPGEELDSYWWEDSDVIDIREGCKDGRTFLFEMGENPDVNMISADEYTMYLYKNDNTLWYWNSDRITYHDHEAAGALIETGDLDYSGNFEQVNIKEIMGITEESNDIPRIITICAVKENVLFLLDNGQVFISKYITKEVRDVEYYDAGNTNPYRLSETSVEPQMYLKELSFRKLDYENIVSISSDKNNNFFLVDKDGNINHYCSEDEQEEQINTYEDYSQFPFENLQYVDEAGYETLKELYEEMDYKSEFETGDTSRYEFYIEKYRSFVNSEVPFYNPKNGETEYLNQYGQTECSNPKTYDLNDFDYFLFDMDGDENPELFISENDGGVRRFFYIFKYDEKQDQFIMWDEMNSVYGCLIGTKKEGTYHYGNFCWFGQLDQNGEYEVSVYFINDAFYSNGVPIYMLSFPEYKDFKPKAALLEEMKQQGYYDKSTGRYYFRVTEEQYNEVYMPFYQVKEEAKENLKAIICTYEEVFGEKWSRENQ